MEVLYGLLIVYGVVFAYQAVSNFVIRRHRSIRATQVASIAATLGGEYEPESSSGRQKQLHVIRGLIQNHDVIMFDSADGRKMVTYLRVRLAGRRSPTFRIRERTWVDKESADMLVSKRYAVSSLYRIRLHDLFDQRSLLALDDYQITAFASGAHVTLRFAAQGIAETKEQYADLIEAAEMIVTRLEAYHRSAVAAQPVRERHTVEGPSAAASTFWRGSNRRQRIPTHQTPAMCPEWLLTRTELNTRQGEN